MALLPAPYFERAAPVPQCTVGYIEVPLRTDEFFRAGSCVDEADLECATMRRKVPPVPSACIAG